MRGKVLEEGKKDIIFPTLEKGEKYFQKRKTILHKKYKDTGEITLLMMAKEIKPNYWVGHKRN
jgi:hypothetical protein